MWWHRASVGRIRAAAFGLGAVVLLAVAVGGCDTAPEDPIVPPASAVDAPPATSAPAQSERDAVVAVYEEFWLLLHTMDDEPKARWDERLAEVAVNPQLKISLQAARFQAMNGETTYGNVTARISDLEIDGGVAKVTDCQDASHSGIADAKSGKHKTVGIARNPVQARLERHSGEWKVANIDYPGGEC